MGRAVFAASGEGEWWGNVAVSVSFLWVGVDCEGLGMGMGMGWDEMVDV